MTIKASHLISSLIAGIVLTTSSLALAQNVAVVNGKPIPKARADAMTKEAIKRGQKEGPELQQMVREELINREIFMQEAEKKGIANTDEIKTQLDLARQSIVIRALVDDFLKKNPVTDAEVKAQYETIKKQVGDKEYHARHILVEKEEDAKAIIAKLKAGGKFEELAKQSKDPGSAPNGGDLDWASPANFVKPFSDAMVALKKGEFTDTPVKTQFGFHIIKLEDVRDAKAPPLEEVRAQMEEQLRGQKLQKYQAELKEKAKVQ